MRSDAGPHRGRPDAGVAATVAIGLAVVVGLGVAARGRPVGEAELDVARWFASWPDWPARPLWAVMQLGSVVGAVAVGSAVVWALRGWRAAGVTAGAALAAWTVARVVKVVVDRGRPADVLPSVETRFEPVLRGGGYASGHAAVAFAVATVVAACLPGRWKVVPFVLAVVVAVGRLYFAAHLLLDVVGGAALGVAIGTLAALALRVRPDAP